MAAPALSPGRERLAFVSQVLQGYQVEVQVREMKCPLLTEHTHTHASTREKSKEI